MSHELNIEEFRVIKRLSYLWERLTSKHWQWGHPDEWSDAEWFYWKKEKWHQW